MSLYESLECLSGSDCVRASLGILMSYWEFGCHQLVHFTVGVPAEVVVVPVQTRAAVEGVVRVAFAFTLVHDPIPILH
jgi:hypothetical protein